MAILGQQETDLRESKAYRGVSMPPRIFVLFPILGLIATGCVAPSEIDKGHGIANSGIPLAPGAEQVKVTRIAGEVANCQAVGNLGGVNGGNLTDAGQRIARNQAIGLGGNTIFDTSSALQESQGVVEGVVYRCN
jgi:hypothetical protein